jgi:hypothetical protein
MALQGDDCVVEDIQSSEIKEENNDEQDRKLDDSSEKKKKKYDEQDRKLDDSSENKKDEDVENKMDEEDDDIVTVYALESSAESGNGEKDNHRSRANERLREELALEEGKQAKEDWNQFLTGMDTDEIAAFDSGCVWVDDPNVRPCTPTAEHALPVEAHHVPVSTPTKVHASPVQVQSVRLSPKKRQQEEQTAKSVQLSPLQRRQLEQKAKWITADSEKKIRELQRKLEADRKAKLIMAEADSKIRELQRNLEAEMRR